VGGTLDQSPGELIEESILLEDTGLGPSSVIGQMRVTNGRFSFVDVIGEYDPRSSVGSGALTSGVGIVDFGTVGHSEEVHISAPSILSGDRPVVNIFADGDDAVAMQDWDIQVVSVTAATGFSVQVQVIKGVAHGTVKFHWGF